MPALRRCGRLVGSEQRKRFRRRHAQVADLPLVRRFRGGLVTDPVTCPQCGGSGEETLGPLTLWCRFCFGHGYVGGDHEPAEESPPPEGAGPPAGESTPVRESGLCPACLGAGVVVGLGGTGEPAGSMVQAPCPLCGDSGEHS